jgi:hypothetical protein
MVAQPVAAQEVSQSAGRITYPVVVELFTSQGCSSCPPADALMAELAKRDDILALALHVDYWDYIGWKDIFADPKFTQRQRGYARAAGHRTIYTPQMIVGGVDHVVGFKPMKLADLVAAQRSNIDPAPIGLSAVRSGENLTITLAPSGQSSNNMKVQVAQFKPLEKVMIRSGENSGKTINYANVVTSWIAVSDWDGATQVTVNLTALTPSPVAVIVQKVVDDMPREIVASLRID